MTNHQKITAKIDEMDLSLHRIQAATDHVIASQLKNTKALAGIENKLKLIDKKLTNVQI